MLPQTAVHWLGSAGVGAKFGAEQFKAKVAINARDTNCLGVIEPLPLSTLMKYGYITKENPKKVLTFEAIIEDNSHHPHQPKSSGYKLHIIPKLKTKLPSIFHNAS